METALATTRTAPEQDSAGTIEQATQKGQQPTETQVRTFSIDEATSIINEAEAMQFLAEKLTHADRKLEQRLGATRISEQAIVATAGEMGVQPQYVARVLKQRYPTLDEQMASLRKLGSQPTYRVLGQAYVLVIEQACKRALPDDMTLEAKRNFHLTWDFELYKIFKYEYISTPSWWERQWGAKPETHTSSNKLHNAASARMQLDDYQGYNEIKLMDPLFATIVAEPLAALNQYMRKYFPKGIHVSHTFLPANCVEGIKA
jgi:hypothetical protein